MTFWCHLVTIVKNYADLSCSLHDQIYTISFTGHIPQVTGTGHSNCAPKGNMLLLKIYIRACLVLLAPLRLFYAVLGQILSDL